MPLIYFYVFVEETETQKFLDPAVADIPQY